MKQEHLNREDFRETLLILSSFYHTCTTAYYKDLGCWRCDFFLNISESPSIFICFAVNVCVNVLFLTFEHTWTLSAAFLEYMHTRFPPARRRYINTTLKMNCKNNKYDNTICPWLYNYRCKIIFRRSVARNMLLME